MTLKALMAGWPWLAPDVPKAQGNTCTLHCGNAPHTTKQFQRHANMKCEPLPETGYKVHVLSAAVLVMQMRYQNGFLHC